MATKKRFSLPYGAGQTFGTRGSWIAVSGILSSAKTQRQKTFLSLQMALTPKGFVMPFPQASATGGFAA